MKQVVSTGRVLNRTEQAEIEEAKAKTRRAFDDAVELGIFSADVNADNYAGGWMYMYTDERGLYAFKNIISRRYIYIQPNPYVPPFYKSD